MTENLIFFDEEEYTNAKRIKFLELMITNLTEQLNVAVSEITVLKQQLYDHINFHHEVEPSSRFHITHVPKNPPLSNSSSSECILIDV